MDGEGKPIPATRFCKVCLDEKPTTREFFQYNRKSPDKCKSICKECMERDRKALDNTALAARVEMVDDAAMNVIKTVAKSKNPARIPHIADIFERIMNLCGGAEGYAQKLMDDYEAAEEGSIQRTQLHKLITTYAMKTTEVGAAEKPTDSLDDDEIESKIEELTTKRLRLMSRAGRVHDVDEGDIADAG